MKTVFECRRWISSVIAPAWIAAMMSAPNVQAQSGTGTATPIKHVVVLFQENVSFDHYFGTYPNASNGTVGEPTFTAAPNTPSVNGLTNGLLTNNPNSTQPFRLPRAQAVTCDQNHSYGPEQQAFDSGLMDKFPQYVGVGSTTASPCNDVGTGTGLTMGYYDGNTLTAFWNYAQNFAMSDNSFGTTFGPSAPGVIHLISGQTHGATVTSGNPSGVVGSGGSLIGDGRPSAALDDCTIASKTLVTMTGQNVGNLLNAKSISWGWFQGGFRPSSVTNGTATCATTHNNISGASAGTDYIPHHAGFMFYPSTANPHHLPPTSVAAIGTSADQANHNYDTIDFFNALSAGNLPAVSFVKAAAYQDGHAGYSDPLDEQTWIVSTINTIMQSPAWSSTAIIIAYDDSDGWYDHVIGPILNQSSTSDDALTGPGACGNGSGAPYQGRCGYGPRLPLLVISPYSKVNYVDHTVTDQSSILRFIEDNWGLGRIGDSSADAEAGPINGMFNFTTPAGKAVYLDPTMGTVLSAPPSTSTTGTTPPAVTAAVATSPQGAIVYSSQFSLSGTASTSADGKPLTYLWTLGPGSPSAAILGANTATPTMQAAQGTGLYSFVLTVTDDTGKTATATVTVQYYAP
jgi:phospholipase C